MSMSPEDEQEMWDDMAAIGSLARSGSDTPFKKVGELRAFHLRILAITRYWTTHEGLKRSNKEGERDAAS